MLRALAHAGASPPVTRIGVTSIPVCGEDAEVLGAHGLSAESIAARVRAELRT